MAYNIIPQRGVFSTIANLINENFQRIYQQILGLDGSGEQAAEDISQLESDVSALQSGKANDADVVHKAGAETITGNKTFTGTVVLTLQNSGILVIDENGVVKSDSIVIVNDVTYEAGDNIFYLKKTVNGTKSNIVQVEVTPNSNSTGLVTSGGIYTALAHKVDKVQSTDNAVVRFDGASGAVQNSGVTINDSNHLTAAKFITSGGTSSQVVLGNGTLIAADILPQYEAYLKWGGKSISNGYSPIDASMIGELGANRLAFPNAGGITVEYSRDSGTTWTDYQASNDKKVGLFSGIRQNFVIGKAASNDVASNTYQLRIKIVAGSGSSAVGVYTQLNKFVFYVNTSGSTGCWCTLKGRKAANYNNNVETYSTYADQVAIVGGSGYNIINTSSIVFGTSDTHTKEITFTFGCTGYNGNGTTNVGLSIYKIFCFGGVGWTEPSNMAQHGHLYYWDSTQNMITPAGVYPKTSSTYNLGSTSFFWKEAYANKFVTKNGTSSQFVKGDGSLDSTTYAPLASPALTGTPTAPTATAGTNTAQIATTAFVKLVADDLAKGIKTISVQYGDATSIVLETEKINGNEGTVSIPAATSQAAGAMSAAQAALLEDLSDLADDIETLLASI